MTGLFLIGTNEASQLGTVVGADVRTHGVRAEQEHVRG